MAGAGQGHREKACVRPIGRNELDAVIDLYYQLIDDIADGPAKPRWVKEVYPSRRRLKQAMETKTLYGAFESNELVGAMVLDGMMSPGHAGAPWVVDADAVDVRVLHLVAVPAACQGKGIGTALVQAAIEICRRENVRSLRLDVIEGNVPAARLYERLGFVHIGRASMYYEETGTSEFDLYELPIEESC